jgi:predicted membrane chloride channel (bestrophin family)
MYDNIYSVLYIYKANYGCNQNSLITIFSLLFSIHITQHTKLLGLVAFYREKQEIGFSPTGHGLLTLLVSFLVISKVNLAYDRFRAVRKDAADTFLKLRELMQLVIAISSSDSQPNNNEQSTTGGGKKDDNNNNTTKFQQDREKELRYWRLECVSKVSAVMDCTVRTVKDRRLACYFARNTPIAGRNTSVENEPDVSALDPLEHAQSLRMHLYCTSDLGIHLLERVTMCNKLQEYINSYNNLLILASTPLPFPLVQMGRACLFLWTFSMPLVLLEGPFSDLCAAMLFLFFLTYGFIGLELVSIKLSDPFGDSRDDVQISKIRDAAMEGIQNDLKCIQQQMTMSERRLQFAGQRRRLYRQQQQQQQQQQTSMTGDKYQTSSTHHPGDDAFGYHTMGGSDGDMGC